MNYKKKYEDAVRKLKKFFINDDDRILYKHDIESAFPELKENEDEKIRKEIISFLKEGEPYYCPNNVKRQDWANWLEKQGEILSIEGVVRDGSFIDFDETGTSFMIPAKKHLFKNGDAVVVTIAKDAKPRCHKVSFLEKQGEQKSDFCHHEVDFSNCSEEYRKAYYDGWNNCNQQHAQLEAEQKPTWSEDDEGMCIFTIKILNEIHYKDNAN